MSEFSEKFVSYKEVLSFYSDIVRNQCFPYDSINVAQTVSIDRALKDGKRKSLPWTKNEEEALNEGVKLYGVGKWKQIKTYFSNVFSENDRTSNDLMNKWNRMSAKPKEKSNMKTINSYFE